MTRLVAASLLASLLATPALAGPRSCTRQADCSITIVIVYPVIRCEVSIRCTE